MQCVCVHLQITRRCRLMVNNFIVICFFLFDLSVTFAKYIKKLIILLKLFRTLKCFFFLYKFIFNILITLLLYASSFAKSYKLKSFTNIIHTPRIPPSVIENTFYLLFKLFFILFTCIKSKMTVGSKNSYSYIIIIWSKSILVICKSKHGLY